MKRIYHPYTKWECYKNGMWNPITKSEIAQHLEAAITFTGNHIEYGKAMIEAANKWRYGMEHHLTDNSINQKAYIGHAGCSFKFGWTEGLVRMAWGMLTEQQRILANYEAQKGIAMWVNRHTKNNLQQTLFT